MGSHRKIGHGTHNLQRNLDARAHQTASEKKPRRPRTTPHAPAGLHVDTRTPYDRPPSAPPAVAPLSMHPVTLLAVLAGITMRGTHDAMLPPGEPALPQRQPATRQLLQQGGSDTTWDLLKKAADDLRAGPCQAIGTLQALQQDGAFASPPLLGLQQNITRDLVGAVGLGPVVTTDARAANYYRNSTDFPASVARVKSAIADVNQAQVDVACAPPTNLTAARTALQKAWHDLRVQETSLWYNAAYNSYGPYRGDSDVYQVYAWLAQSWSFTTEGIMPSAAQIAALQPANLTGLLGSSAIYDAVFAAADTMKLFDVSRSAAAYAQVSLALQNQTGLWSTGGVNRLMASQAQAVPGRLGEVLVGLQMDNTTYNFYRGVNPGVLVQHTLAQAATLNLVKDDAHVDGLWIQANTTGADAQTLADMQVARGAWQDVRLQEASVLRASSVPQGPTLQNIQHAMVGIAGTAESNVSLLHNDLLPGAHATAQGQSVLAGVRNVQQFTPWAWQSWIDLGVQEPEFVSGAALFALRNLDVDAGYQGDLQNTFISAITIAQKQQRDAFARVTTPTGASMFSPGWRKLLVQQDLRNDTGGLKVRWSEWVAMANGMNRVGGILVNGSLALNSTLFDQAMQATGLDVVKRDKVTFGSASLLSTPEGGVQHPAVNVLATVAAPDAWREAAVNLAMSPWMVAKRNSDVTNQAMAALLGMRLQTAQGDTYPAAYEALVGAFPEALQKQAYATFRLDSVLSSLWPELKARVRYHAETRTWQSKSLSDTWDGKSVRSADTLDGLQLTYVDKDGKQQKKDVSGWVGDAMSSRCASFDSCPPAVIRY